MRRRLLAGRSFNMEKETYKDLSEKHGYLPVERKCPICETFTLERQVFGYEEVIFCTQCSYNETHDI